MEKLLKKRGQLVGTTTNTVVAIMIFIFIVFAVLFAIATLNPASFFTAGSASANATTALQDNTTSLVSNVSNQLPTVGKVLGIVLILGVIALLIVIILRFRGTGGGDGSL